MLSPSRLEASDVVIDFLLRQDVEKFKRFYVLALQAESPEDLEKNCRDIYGTGLEDIQSQWHKDLAKVPNTVAAG